MSDSISAPRNYLFLKPLIGIQGLTNRGSIDTGGYRADPAANDSLKLYLDSWKITNSNNTSNLFEQLRQPDSEAHRPEAQYTEYSSQTAPSRRGSDPAGLAMYVATGLALPKPDKPGRHWRNTARRTLSALIYRVLGGPVQRIWGTDRLISARFEGGATCSTGSSSTRLNIGWRPAGCGDIGCGVIVGKRVGQARLGQLRRGNCVYR
ncbi:uncharacterized protein LOC143297713 [Babylonia areolata]|uniref:uncharacterized protein LOC143297713 n=1 Tax=Babylonia areolata TaxID=304850 RepID=UPI003FD252F2